LTAEVFALSKEVIMNFMPKPKEGGKITISEFWQDVENFVV